MDELFQLSQEFASAPNQRAVRAIVSQALMHPQIDEFVGRHKDGWIGVEGAFARQMALVLLQDKLCANASVVSQSAAVHQ